MTRCLHHGERVPERIGYLVYAAAFLLPNGASLGGTIQSVHPDAAPIFTADETALTNVPPGPWKRSTARRRHAGSKLRAPTNASNHSRRSPRQSLSRKSGFGSEPRAHIEATEDQVLPLSLQRSMQAQLPCDPVFSIDCDHVLPSSAPDLLTNHLIEIANRVDRTTANC
jgi:hypothetical protein